jgi:DNA-directed RNA polymerase specialized sigma24 family protein
LVTRRHRSMQREVLADDVWDKDPGTSGDSENLLGAGHRHEIEPGLQTRIDVHRVLTGLPPRLRALALLLSELSVLEVCARMGKSRSRVYQMTQQLREAFRRAGYRSCRPHNAEGGTTSTLLSCA